MWKSDYCDQPSLLTDAALEEGLSAGTRGCSGLGSWAKPLKVLNLLISRESPPFEFLLTGMTLLDQMTSMVMTLKFYELKA